MRLVRPLLVMALAVITTLSTHDARAFCGFYVDTGGAPLFNEATRVVLMRAGTRTVLSIQNDYKGPPEGFALVVPVPIVLQKENVRTLPAGLFERRDRLSSPRLVEYWEQDPCEDAGWDDDKEGGTGSRAKAEDGALGQQQFGTLVTIEAEFSVDEYDIVVLSASDSTALEQWLRENRYQIPAGAEPVLRPYVQSGSKFFVAKVDAKKVRFRWGRAALSPLRFHYDTPDFALPIRLGLINSAGAQDLLVHVLAADRYEAANYDNLTIPTNLTVTNEVRSQFARFYAALFDRTVAGHPRAVVTEYAWSPSSCDPCPIGSGPLPPEDVALFGGDVMPSMPPALVLTRLHARYTKDTAGEDLVFRVAPPIDGGREAPGADGVLPRTAVPSGSNAFQARYVIRHPWTGGVTCDRPRWGVWGGPTGGAKRGAQPSTGAALVGRDLDISKLVLDTEAERAVTAGGGARAGVLDRLAALLEERDDRALAGLALLVLGAIVAAVSGARRGGGRGAARAGAAYTLLAVAMVGSGLLGRRSGNWLGGVGDVVSTITGVVGIAVGAVFVATRAGGLVERSGRAGTILVAGATAPALAGFIAGLRVAHVEAEVLSDIGGNLDWASRILSALAAETLEPIARGCIQSALLLMVVAILLARATEKGAASVAAAERRPAIVALVVVVAARWLIRDHPTPLDAFALLACARGLALVVRSRQLGDRARAVEIAMAVTTAVVLLDVAARMVSQADGLSAISGESVDPSQRARIMVITAAEERARLVLACVDAAALIGVAWLGGLRAAPGAPPGRWAIANGVVGAIVVALAATAFVWTGRARSFASIAEPVAHLSPEPTSGAHASSATGARVSPDLSGPALFVDASSSLFATPGSDTPRRPFGPALFDEMARASAASQEATLLVAHPTLTLAGLLRGLAPLVESRQLGYRLVAQSSSEVVPALYAPLFGARALRAIEVELAPELPLSASPTPTRSPRGVGVLHAGDELELVPLSRSAAGFHFDTFALPSKLPLEADGATDDAIATRIGDAGAFDRAVLALDPDASVKTVAMLVARLRDLRSPDARARGRPFFGAIVVSPGRRALLAALRR